MTLQRLNMDVVVTENGAEALEVLEGPDPPQLAILDWMMPEMDGIDLCQSLRLTDDFYRFGFPGYYVLVLPGTNAEPSRSCPKT